MDQSKFLGWNLKDTQKAAKGLAISGIAAGAVIFLASFNFIDADLKTTLTMAISASIVNILKLWITGQTK